VVEQPDDTAAPATAVVVEEPAAEEPSREEPEAQPGEAGYVPMSEWLEDFDRR
jgi:hypothetical protein